MDRDTGLYAVVALLGVLAVALAAATLPATVRPEVDSGPEGPGDGGGIVATPPPDSPGAAIEVPFLSELLTLLGLVAILASLWYMYHHRREAFGVVAGAAVVVVGAFLLFRVLSPVLASGDPLAAPELGNVTSIGGGAGGDAVATTDPSVPSVLLVFLLGVALSGAGLALMRWVGRRETDHVDESSPADAPDEAAAVGRAAGRAADRLEDAADVDNEVYRAWTEMTDLLELPRPDAKTPGEFAAAAVEAGVEPDDVRELTRLFETVRYGNHRPSSADERRAHAVFRRIEATYARDER